MAMYCLVFTCYPKEGLTARRKSASAIPMKPCYGAIATTVVRCPGFIKPTKYSLYVHSKVISLVSPAWLCRTEICNAERLRDITTMVDCAPRLNPLTTRQLMTAVDCRLSKLRYKAFDWLRCAGRPIVTRPVLGLESHAPANDGALIAAKSYGWPLH